MLQASRKTPLPLQLVILVTVAASISIGCSALERHDEVTTSPPVPDAEMKCPCFACGCKEIPPPPPLLPPPHPLLPPPPPKYPTSYCPPPPAPYLYTEGPPAANLYPLQPYFYTSGACRSCIALLPVLVMCGLLTLGGFWSL